MAHQRFTGGSDAPGAEDSAGSAGEDAPQGAGETPSPAVERPYTAAEVDIAIAALQQPERLRHAQEVVTHAAPALQRALAEALQEGGWFGEAHDAEVARAAGEADDLQRQRAVAALVAEQTRLGMFVGAAVGFQLARELERGAEAPVQADAPDTP
jgi:hypothetical protein